MHGSFSIPLLRDTKTQRTAFALCLARVFKKWINEKANAGFEKEKKEKSQAGTKSLGCYHGSVFSLYNIRQVAQLTRNSAEKADCTGNTWLLLLCWNEEKTEMLFYHFKAQIRLQTPSLMFAFTLFLDRTTPFSLPTHKPHPFKENAGWLWRYCWLGSAPFLPFYLDEKVN